MNHGRKPGDQERATHTEQAVGHEASDAQVRPLMKFLLALFISTAIVFVAMGLLFNILVEQAAVLDRPPSPIAEGRQVPPSPQLQVSPAAELKRLRESEDRTLNSYGWIDRERGVARIPIDRAMDLLLEKGLPYEGTGDGAAAER